MRLYAGERGIKVSTNVCCFDVEDTEKVLNATCFDNENPNEQKHENREILLGFVLMLINQSFLCMYGVK